MKKTIMVFAVLMLVRVNYAVQNIYMMGNSYTGQYEQAYCFGNWSREFANNDMTLWTIGAAGIRLPYFIEKQGNTSAYAYNSVPGIWDPNAMVWTNALANKNWDILSLQTFFENSAAEIQTPAEQIMQKALQTNPDIQVYIYGVWEMPDDINTTKYAKRQADFETAMHYLRTKFPNAKPVLIVPASQVIKKLSDMANSGQLPEVNNHTELYEDYARNELHLGALGRYAVICAWWSCFYQEYPSLLPSGTFTVPQNTSNPAWVVPAATAEVIKTVAWDIVSNYQYSGVTATTISAPLTVRSRQAAPAPTGIYTINGKAVPRIGLPGAPRGAGYLVGNGAESLTLTAPGLWQSAP